MAPPTLVVEWGRRSKSLQALLQSKIAGDSFMLASPGAGPVELGWVSPFHLGSWDTAMTIVEPVSRSGNQLEVTATLNPPRGNTPADPVQLQPLTHLRLDFELSITAGGKKAIALGFRQLFLVGAGGTLAGTECAIDDVSVKASPSGPTMTTQQGQLRRKRFLGLHPLLSISPNLISVNAEFVDLTSLWWAIRKDKVGWYLHPELGGRQTDLRVLGWTGGGTPMIWFAVMSDAAVLSLDLRPKKDAPSEKNADVIYFRPPAEPINSFPYTSDERGLIDARHDDKTQRILARYLLSPIPEARFSSIKSSVTDADFMAERLQPNGGTPPTAPVPADPMDIAFGYPYAFRPVGLETAFNRADQNKVLFLPLAAGDTATPYEGAVRKDLRSTIMSALATLWNGRAVARSATSVPNFTDREFWLAGHSGGNFSMWTCAQNNPKDVARMMTFDASPWVSNLAGGVNTMRLVAKARGDLGKKLDVFAIVTPNLSQARKPPPSSPFQGLDDATDVALRGTGASITVLPEFARRESFWNPLPPSTPKSYVQNLLANWSDSLITSSAKRPDRWRFLFFHEMAVFGGDLIQPPAGAPPNTPPILRTFFEQALGASNPRPPP